MLHFDTIGYIFSVAKDYVQRCHEDFSVLDIAWDAALRVGGSIQICPRVLRTYLVFVWNITTKYLLAWIRHTQKDMQLPRVISAQTNKDTQGSDIRKKTRDGKCRHPRHGSIHCQNGTVI